MKIVQKDLKVPNFITIGTFVAEIFAKIMSLFHHLFSMYFYEYSKNKTSISLNGEKQARAKLGQAQLKLGLNCTELYCTEVSRFGLVDFVFWVDVILQAQ